jgi:hypothetical protein
MKRIGRPPSINSRWFYRELTMPDKLILACAGDGNISDGFRNVLDAYQILWNCGYRPTVDLHDFLGVDKDEIEQGPVGDSGAN